jgi:hypothetical protein
LKRKNGKQKAKEKLQYSTSEKSKRKKVMRETERGEKREKGIY